MLSEKLERRWRTCTWRCSACPRSIWEKAQRIFMAEWAMYNEVTSKQLLKLAGLRKDDEDDDDESDDEDEGGDASASDGDNSDSSGFDSKRRFAASGRSCLWRAEALGSEVAASIAAQARAALASAMVAVGNMGTVAADKAQELYESMENAINSWLQDNVSTVQSENSDAEDIALETDTASGQFRQSELDTAKLLQEQIGPLTRSPDKA